MQSCKNLFPACKLFAPQQENSPGRLWKRDKTRHTMPAPGPAKPSAKPPITVRSCSFRRRSKRHGNRVVCCARGSAITQKTQLLIQEAGFSVWKFCLPFFPKKDIQIVCFSVDHGADGHEFALDAVEDLSVIRSPAVWTRRGLPSASAASRAGRRRRMRP